MPDHTIEADEHERQLLELVRQQQGLQSLDQAAEFLLRKHIRDSSARITGRGRALYPVNQGGRR